MKSLSLPDQHYCCSLPAVSSLLAAIAGTLRELDRSNEDCPATNWILQTMMQTYPKFVEEGADLDEEERDKAMLLYAIFHQMCFPEEMKST